MGDQTRTGELRVIGKGDKEGIALVPPFIMLMFEDWISREQDSRRLLDDDELLFKIKDNTWMKILHHASERGINQRINTHSLRHSCGTALFAAGMDSMQVKEALRHQSISSTQIYIQVNKKQLKEKHQSIWG